MQTECMVWWQDLQKYEKGPSKFGEDGRRWMRLALVRVVDRSDGGARRLLCPIVVQCLLQAMFVIGTCHGGLCFTDGGVLLSALVFYKTMLPLRAKKCMRFSACSLVSSNTLFLLEAIT